MASERSAWFLLDNWNPKSNIPHILIRRSHSKWSRFWRENKKIAKCQFLLFTFFNVSYTKMIWKLAFFSEILINDKPINPSPENHHYRHAVAKELFLFYLLLLSKSIWIFCHVGNQIIWLNTKTNQFLSKSTFWILKIFSSKLENAWFLSKFYLAFGWQHLKF